MSTPARCTLLNKRAECFTFQVPSLAMYIPVISDSIVTSTKTAPILFGPNLDYKSTNKGTLFGVNPAVCCGFPRIDETQSKATGRPVALLYGQIARMFVPNALASRNGGDSGVGHSLLRLGPPRQMMAASGDRPARGTAEAPGRKGTLLPHPTLGRWSREPT